ncbi:hypothetical protein CRE_25238 [Caenorhabditis remanei]|uniref:GDP-fucose pyrophosphorylase domain-containing protein n=1 Tax=Caenorhabditis remanei TaxID=31234 RepID=E3LS33_CAERE|nr:hypothetical protein CRE_25238 [Caenorhabditis remanei]
MSGEIQAKTIANIPPEIMSQVMTWLEPAYILNSALTSIQMAEFVVRSLPRVRDLKIRISNDDFSGSFRENSIELQVPQVNQRATKTVLKILLDHLGNAIESLHLENDLTIGEVPDDFIACVLNCTKDAHLKELVLSDIDLERIHTWTLALLAGFRELEKVEIEACNLGEDASPHNTEAKLLRYLQPSFQTLTQIDLKGTPQITDNFSRRISRSCPNLSYFRISGCPLVTTLSALPFIELTRLRRTDKLDVHMDNTDFDADQLRSFMHSPLFASTTSEWRLNPIAVPLGFQKPAVLATHSSRKYVLIFMWQKLILTAGSDSQNLLFRQQLASIPTDKFCESVEVVTDESPGIRIGSGGATLSIIRTALESYQTEDLQTKKILLLHSGGLSQRMPHLSAFGKAYGTLPNSKTILETKLEIYEKDLLMKLPETGGIMITASDVIENMENAKKVNSEVDIVIFAHVSSIEVGTQHGVFVIDENTNKLKRVLQKPTVDEMKEDKAIREDGTVLTDSCYFLTWKFCERLLKISILQTPVTEELCCYGDFMRPMGSNPKLDYIEKSPQNVRAYRKALADIFSLARVDISVLGDNTFFHFGTYHEYIESLMPNSEFRRSFPHLYKTNIIFSKGVSAIPDSSLAEYSSGVDLKVGENSVVSGIDSGEDSLNLPRNILAFTMALKGRMFVSVIVKIDEDIKKKSNMVKWNGHYTRIDGHSLWEAPLFEICETRAKSLKATLREWENGMTETRSERISISEAVKRHDLEADLEWRRSLTDLKMLE